MPTLEPLSLSSLLSDAVAPERIADSLRRFASSPHSLPIELAQSLDRQFTTDLRWTPVLLASIRDVCLDGSMTCHNDPYHNPEIWLSVARAAQDVLGELPDPLKAGQEASSTSGSVVLDRIGKLVLARREFSMVEVYGEIEDASLTKDDLFRVLRLCRQGMLTAIDQPAALCFRGIASCVQTLVDTPSLPSVKVTEPDRAEPSRPARLEKPAIDINLPRATIRIDGRHDLPDAATLARKFDVEGLLRRFHAAIDSDTMRDQDFASAVAYLRGDTSASWPFGGGTTTRLFISSGFDGGVHFSVLHNLKRSGESYHASQYGKKEHEAGIRSILLDLASFGLLPRGLVDEVIATKLPNIA